MFQQERSPTWAAWARDALAVRDATQTLTRLFQTKYRLDGEDTDDLVQVALSAAMAKDRPTEEPKRDAWLGAFARNVWRNALRAKTRRMSAIEAYEAETVSKPTAPVHSGARRKGLLGQTRDACQAFIEARSGRPWDKHRQDILDLLIEKQEVQVEKQSLSLTLAATERRTLMTFWDSALKLMSWAKVGPASDELVARMEIFAPLLGRFCLGINSASPPMSKHRPPNVHHTALLRALDHRRLFGRGRDPTDAELAALSFLARKNLPLLKGTKTVSRARQRERDAIKKLRRRESTKTMKMIQEILERNPSRKPRPINPESERAFMAALHHQSEETDWLEVL